MPPQQNKGFKHNIPINVARTVQKVTIIKFIWPKIARKPENKFYNRINLLICVSGYYPGPLVPTLSFMGQNAHPSIQGSAWYRAQA